MPKKQVPSIAPVHRLAPELLSQPVKIALVGCGGNGSQMLTKLARLDFALRECGHPFGLQVIAFDPDRVSRANVGRQCFSPADVGLYKAVVLINRLNCFYGLDWHACPERYKGAIPSFLVGGSLTNPDFLVTCVDTARARRDIHKMFSSAVIGAPRYWLDLGNKKSDGQVILGQPADSLYNQVKTGTVNSGALGQRKVLMTPLAARLPTVVEMFPELLDPRLKEDDAPSCSVADALKKQSLFVNDHVSDWAMQLLDNLLRLGEIQHHGAFINLESGRVNALPVPRAETQAAEIQRAVA